LQQGHVHMNDRIPMARVSIYAVSYEFKYHRHMADDLGSFWF
jgi:hypothetical protein